MATNKRRDAAALFELIDKSTLRASKGASGGVKIPSWWSHKTNAPAKVPATTSAASPQPSAGTVENAVAGALPPPVPKTPPGLPEKAPVYAPQPLNRVALLGGTRPGTFPGTGVPLWIAGAAALVVVIVIAAIVVGVGLHRQAETQPSGAGPVPPLGAPGGSYQSVRPYDPRNDGALGAGGVGHVLGSQTNRDPTKFYLVIEQYRLQETALKAANILADHGVDVAIEQSGGRYWLISGLAFADMAAPDAQDFRETVIKIGLLPVDGKKPKNGVFPNAYFAHVNRGT